MDFEDETTTLTLSQECLDLWETNKTKFAAELLNEIGAKEYDFSSDVPLMNGGYVEDEHIIFSDIKITDETNGVLKGSVKCKFVESVVMGCRSHPLKHDAEVIMYFTLRLSDGEVSFEFGPYHDMTGE